MVRLGTGGTHYRAETNDESTYILLRAEGLDWEIERDIAQKALDDFAVRYNLSTYDPKAPMPWKSPRKSS